MLPALMTSYALLHACKFMLKRSCSNFSVCAFSLSPFPDKLTKEEEEIYKLQHDLERTAISQQQSKKISEVSSLRLTQQEYAVEVMLRVP